MENSNDPEGSALNFGVTDMADIKKLNGKARLVGINHVALEVGSIEEAALAFLWPSCLTFRYAGACARMAFIDLGDQFINLSENRDQHQGDEGRHFGLIVDVIRRRSDASLKRRASRLCPGGAWNSGIRGATGFKSWSTAISNSPESTARCSRVWVARTFTNRLQRSRSSPRRASRLRKSSQSADCISHV